MNFENIWKELCKESFYVLVVSKDHSIGIDNLTQLQTVVWLYSPPKQLNELASQHQTGCYYPRYDIIKEYLKLSLFRIYPGLKKDWDQYVGMSKLISI